MDYINLPRELIYKDRDNLKDFEVNNKNSINSYLFLKLKEMPLMYMEGALATALRCFNNAYYICTLIQFEDFPEIRVADYEQKLLEENIMFNEDICSTSMAMVCILLPAYDIRWKQEDNDLIKAINYRFTHYRWFHSEYRKRFENMVGSISPTAFNLNQGEFAPRDIIEVIESFPEKDLMTYAEYICERLALVKNQQQRIYGSDMAIARLKDYQRELCRESLYNPKKDSFNYSNNEGMPLTRDLSYEERIRFYYKQSKKAIDYYALQTLDYYKEYDPQADGNCHEQQTDASPSFSDNTALVAENEQLRQQVAQLNSQVNELVKDNDELKERVAEFSEPVENLTAEQKVRMAFVLSLFEAAGLTDEKLNQHRNKAKVATVMSLLTGISSTKNKRGNDAQTCQTFLTDQKYYPRKQNMEILIRLNTLCAELGINACLSLESQSNNKK